MARPRFIDLSKRRRREQVIRLKNCIRHGGGTPSQCFATSEDWEYHLSSGGQIFDLSFPGRDPFTYWNARFFTTRCAQDFIIDAMAAEETQRVISAEDRERNAKAPFWASSQPIRQKVGNHFETVHRVELAPSPKLASLGGLTWSEHTALMKERICSECPPKVEEELWVRRNYKNGIGLFAIIEADVLDLAVIERTIDRFLASGEVAHLPKGISQFCLAKAAR